MSRFAGFNIFWVNLKEEPKITNLLLIPGSSRYVKFVPKFTRKTYQFWQKFYISGRSRYVSLILESVELAKSHCIPFFGPQEPMEIHEGLGRP